MDLISALTVFVLAIYVGFEVITKVPPTLHTPLMSGSNFVHGIVLVGAMFALGIAETPAEQIIGFIAAGVCGLALLTAGIIAAVSLIGEQLNTTFSTIAGNLTDANS